MVVTSWGKSSERMFKPILWMCDIDNFFVKIPLAFMLAENSGAYYCSSNHYLSLGTVYIDPVSS